ncbi:MAG: hypothetical protein EXS48_00695 [Candidatus Staskawiczbacteria bacterium]|nr:hypothetical protein [Candidatus Staskawiczbacteria bacterium]
MAKKNNLGKEVLIGAGLVAVAAAAAGAYFLYGSKNAKQNRKQVKAWTLKAKGEVLEKLEKLKDINEDIYQKVVNEVSKKYQAVKSIDKKDVLEFAKELHSHWKSISKEIVAFHKAKGKK